MRKKSLFVSWGGEQSQVIGQWLCEKVFSNIPDLEVYMSPMTPSGVNWRDELLRRLRMSTHAVAILTDVSLNRPWFLYEIATLYQRLGKVPILRFCQQPPDKHPLDLLQLLEGFKFDSVLEIADDLLKDRDQTSQRLSKRAIEEKRADWDSFVRPMASMQKDNEGVLNAISAVTETLRGYSVFWDLRNSCMRELARKTIDDFAATFRGLGDSRLQSFKVDQSRYPEYLVQLQNTLGCRTIAVALVNEVEEFWAQKTGVEILARTHPDSERVFVFKDKETLHNYFGHLAQHADKYHVRAISRREFHNIAEPHAVDGDFSVLTDPKKGNQVAAFYDAATRSIHFTANPIIVRNHRMAFEDIRARAIPVRVPPGADRNACRDRLIATLFPAHEESGLQHSDVISIVRYDAFEEDHPYYREMHAFMLDAFRSRAGEHDSTFPVLEIGAGTGHFTKRLAQQPFPRLQITALDPDPRGREIIERKFAHRHDKVKVSGLNALYLRVQEEYRFIFSSFSDHHIKREDKPVYLQNIHRALKPGGFFIVGDEFLAPHNVDRAEDYVEALGRYHQFIIDEANRRHCYELAELEKLAWDSGLPTSPRRVDYKTSLQHYQSFIDQSGLKQVDLRCISPEQLAATTGGMYVLVLQKQ